MEQLSIDFTERSDAEIIREALVKEINNPEFTKYLVVEANKDETISIRAKSFLCAKIKLTRKVKYIVVRTKNIDCFADYIASNKAQVTTAEDQLVEETKEWSRIPITSIDDVLALTKPLSIVFILVLSELGGERFGCCARYVQCSDERKCINPDFLMALACAYKRHLEAGRIFYGKNKNI